jgi:hypothetical protein
MRPHRHASSHEPRAQSGAGALFDPLAELVVHGPLLAAPIGGTAQDHGLLGLGVAREFDLDAFMDLVRPPLRDRR